MDTIVEHLKHVRRGWSLPQAFYTDEVLFKNDLEQIHFKYWLYAGHAGKIKKPGDFFTYEIGDESILVIRDKDLSIRAFYNVCTHRGSRICLSESGNHKVLVCPYHQWSFNLNGELMNSRQMGEGFDKSKFALHKIHVQVMEDLIFVNLSNDPVPFDCMIDDVLPQLKVVGMTKTKIAYEQTYEVHANWKLIAENFRECYHCHIGHPEYIRAVEGIHKHDKEHVNTCLTRWKSQGILTEAVPFTDYNWHHCQRYPFHAGYVTESLDGKPVAPLMGDYKETDMGTFCIVAYPNFWFESSSDHAITMRHTPVSAKLTKITMTWFVDEHAVEGQDYDVENLIAFWKRTGEQDWKLCSDNQAGVNSKAYQPGPYGEAEVEIIKFQNWYLKNISL